MKWIVFIELLQYLSNFLIQTAVTKLPTQQQTNSFNILVVTKYTIYKTSSCLNVCLSFHISSMHHLGMGKLLRVNLNHIDNISAHWCWFHVYCIKTPTYKYGPHRWHASTSAKESCCRMWPHCNASALITVKIYSAKYTRLLHEPCSR